MASFDVEMLELAVGSDGDLVREVEKAGFRVGRKGQIHGLWIQKLEKRQKI